MEKEIELIDLLKTIRRRLKMIIILSSFFVLITGLLSYFVIPPLYEAKATLLVQTQKSEGQNPLNEIMANQELVKTYAEIIKSRLIAEDVINKLNLAMTTEDLLEKVEVTAANDSLVTSITVTDDDPRRAVAIADGFAESFQARLPSLMKVDNISILDQAKAEPDPVRPKPFLYMAASAVLGLMVGVALAFLFEHMDKTVKSEEEIEALLGVPVLGVIANFDKVKSSRKRKKRRRSDEYKRQVG